MVRPSEVLQEQVRDVRRRSGLSQAGLAELMRAKGYDQLTRTAISKLELGTRNITLDDALALAAALGISPVNLFVPYDPHASVDLTNTISVKSDDVRHWVYGFKPLPDSDANVFLREVPPGEAQIRRSSDLGALNELYDQIAEALDTASGERADELVELPNSLHTDLLLLRRKYRREIRDAGASEEERAQRQAADVASGARFLTEGA